MRRAGRPSADLGGVVQFEELRFVCQQAARDLTRTRDRPLPPTVVLPGPERTRLVELAGFPGDDEERHAYLAAFARDEIAGPGVPAWGFVAEGEVGGADMAVVVYGARRHAPAITAAPFTDDGLDDFLPDEALDPTALPYLHPLQHAVDSLPPEEGPPGPGPGGQLPLTS